MPKSSATFLNCQKLQLLIWNMLQFNYLLFIEPSASPHSRNWKHYIKLTEFSLKINLQNGLIKTNMYKTKSCCKWYSNHVVVKISSLFSYWNWYYGCRYPNIIYDLRLSILSVVLSMSSGAFLSSGSLNLTSDSNHVIVPCSGIHWHLYTNFKFATV